jgi:hypothetical protein
MKKPSRVVLAAALLIAPLTISAQEPEKAPEPEMETVLVTGEQPGPGLWKVSRDGHVLWILGTIGAMPDTFVWRTKELEARIAESQEVLYPGWPRVNIDIGVFEGLTLVPAAFKAAKNPNGARLKDVMPAEGYETWLRLKNRYLPDEDDDIEKYRPMIAEEKLLSAIGEKHMKGLRFVWAETVVKKLAKKHRVRVNELPAVVREIEVEKPRAILKAARNVDLAEGECVGRNLLKIEKSVALGLFDFDARPTNAWATGDIEALRPKPASGEDLQREDCITASLDAASKRTDAVLPADMSRALDLVKQQEEQYKAAGAESYLNWMAAAEAALAKNTSTIAVLPMGTVLSPTQSWVDKLAERGYLVEQP